MRGLADKIKCALYQIPVIYYTTFIKISKKNTLCRLKEEEGCGINRTMNYKETINLPRTSFSMKANLPEKEPELVKFWEEKRIYEELLEERKEKEKFILHDGPPYANGHIHLGTALNKILKDIVLKYKAKCGYSTPFIPGWDCHGMPIEHSLFQEIKKRKDEIEPVIFRKKAGEFAKRFIDIQRKEFRRLGILADWENPYLTLSPEYEASIVKAFGELYLSGYIYQAYKPIYWCFNCETALAEAEVEYENDISPSIYVKFPVSKESLSRLSTIDHRISAYFLVWTTTPWTLPANLALALHPEFEYGIFELKGEYLISEEGLFKEICEKSGNKFSPPKMRLKGKELTSLTYRHPFLKKKLPVITADFVSKEEGAGIVHIAPGHGEEDYQIGLKNNLEVFSPIDEKGNFTSEVEEFCGENVFSANPLIIEKLKSLNRLFYNEEITHEYPHCWRCKKPVIFRATLQWFLDVDHKNLRKRLMEAAEKVEWVPKESKNRLKGMLQTRPDWCLSRQRLWGVPLPVIYCEKCKKPIITEETIKRIEDVFKKEGSDAWFLKGVDELFPSFSCPFCGNKRFRKEKDILDVWFDSGVSHMAVLQNNPRLSFPADLYLEGSDQHRGWFQTSLITSVGIKEESPFRSVITHGFFVDSSGKKMSKSLGNVITSEEIIEKFGADILRLWIASQDYQKDIPISKEILNQLSAGYRNLRNTFRFILGNLHNFDPEKDFIEKENLFPVDRWILAKGTEMMKESKEFYEKFLFHKSLYSISNFSNTDLSSFYFDIIKDRLYTYGKDSWERKSAQTTLYLLGTILLSLLSPILSFTTEEVWKLFPKKEGDKISIHIQEFPSFKNYENSSLLKEWERLFEIRRAVLKSLEEAREKKEIGSSLQAKISISTSDKTLLSYLNSFLSQIPFLLIVSEVEVREGKEKLNIEVKKTQFLKCARCWIYHPTVGKDRDYPDLCGKCVKIIKWNTY